MKGLLFWILLQSVGFAQAGAVLPPDAEAQERLAAGEVITLASGSDRSGGAVRMQIQVQAPARAVWDVIISCELAFAFIDGLQACEVLEQSGDRALVHQVVKQGWLIPTYDFVFESLRQPYRDIEFRLVEGNLKLMQGRWSFKERAGGTLVDYEIHIQPAVPVPGFLVRRNMNSATPDLLACIRGLAGGSGSSEQARLDLDRCRGPTASSR